MLSVAFLVKTIERGSPDPRSEAIISRVLKIMRAASTESLCPERPGFAPTFALKSAMDFIMAFGFGHEVAALSKYIICIF